MTDEREDNVNSVIPPTDYLTGAETELGWVARPLNEGRESLAGLDTHLNWEIGTVNLFSKPDMGMERNPQRAGGKGTKGTKLRERVCFFLPVQVDEMFSFLVQHCSQAQGEGGTGGSAS